MSNNKKIESILTPAANEALNELVNDYRSQILLSAYRISSSATGEAVEISIRDVIEGIEKSSRLSLLKRATPSQMVMRYALPGGIVYALLGFGYFFIRNVMSPLDPIDLFSLGIGSFGVLFALFAYYYKKTRAEMISDPLKSKRFQVQRLDREIRLIQLWRDIELVSRDVVSANYGESEAQKPLRVLLDNVMKLGHLSIADHDYLKNMLEMRNTILHQQHTLGKDEIDSAIENGERVFHRLQSVSDVVSK